MHVVANEAAMCEAPFLFSLSLPDKATFVSLAPRCKRPRRASKSKEIFVSSHFRRTTRRPCRAADRSRCSHHCQLVRTCEFEVRRWCAKTSKTGHKNRPAFWSPFLVPRYGNGTKTVAEFRAVFGDRLLCAPPADLRTLIPQRTHAQVAPYWLLPRHGEGEPSPGNLCRLEVQHQLCNVGLLFLTPSQVQHPWRHACYRRLRPQTNTTGTSNISNCSRYVHNSLCGRRSIWTRQNASRQ